MILVYSLVSIPEAEKEKYITTSRISCNDDWEIIRYIAGFAGHDSSETALHKMLSRKNR